MSRAVVTHWQPPWADQFFKLETPLSYRNLQQAIYCWSQSTSVAIRVQTFGLTPLDLIVRRKAQPK